MGVTVRSSRTAGRGWVLCDPGPLSAQESIKDRCAHPIPHTCGPPTSIGHSMHDASALETIVHSETNNAIRCSRKWWKTLDCFFSGLKRRCVTVRLQRCSVRLFSQRLQKLQSRSVRCSKRCRHRRRPRCDEEILF